MNTNNWKQVLGESILIPRRSQEERQKTRLDSIKRLLRQTHIDGDLDASDTPITNLGNLESISGDLDLHKTLITNLGNLESIDGDLDLHKTPITNLGNLTSVGRDLNLSNTPISKMNKLQRQEIVKNVKVKEEIIYD